MGDFSKGFAVAFGEDIFHLATVIKEPTDLGNELFNYSPLLTLQECLGNNTTVIIADITD